MSHFRPLPAPNSNSDEAPKKSGPSRAKSHRDGFLDALRAIATIRVVIWHAFGASIISWFVAAIPAMFFVFGSLLAASIEKRRRITPVLRDRFRRISLPLAAFAVATWTAIALSPHSVDFDLPRLVTWLIPIVDPGTASWEGGWLSSPLWFLRMIVWLLLLAPILLPLTNRFPRSTLAALIAAVFITDMASRQQSLAVSGIPTLWWKLGDVALYGAFTVLGFWHHYGLLQIQKRKLGLIIGASAIGAVAWFTTQPVPLGVVNNSHPLHLFVGCAWLAAALLFRSRITAATLRPNISRALAFMTRRSMTIYLWHTTAIAGSIWLLNGSDIEFGPFRPVAFLLLVAIGTYVLTLLFGWAEDVGANRRAQIQHIKLTPTRRPTRSAAVLVGSLAVVLTTGNLVTAGSTSQSARKPPPIPSQQPPAPDFTSKASIQKPLKPVPLDRLPATLDSMLKDWQKTNKATGAQAQVITADGQSFIAARGEELNGDKLHAANSFDIASITKLMTATLVYKAADEGLVDLDAPLPHLDAMPNFPYSDKLTPRLLLSHRSGLVNYRDTARYMEDSTSITTPQEAVQVSSGEPLGFEPGSSRNYSSVNYIILGFLIEQIYNRTYDDILNEELLVPLSLQHTASLPPVPGEPNYSTAGTLTNMGDLTSMTMAILRNKALLTEESFAAMTDIDPESGLGAGTIGFCPCGDDGNGTFSFHSIGHYGSDTLAVYVPTLDIVVAFRATDGIHSEGRLEKTIELVNQLAQVVHISVANAQIPAA